MPDCSPESIRAFRQKHPNLWSKEVALAMRKLLRTELRDRGAIDKTRTAGPAAPNTDTAARMRRGAELLAAGNSQKAASRLLGMSDCYLRECKRRFPELWEAELSRAFQQIAKMQPDASGSSSPRRPTDLLQLEIIRRAVGLILTGLTLKAAAATMEIDPKQLYRLKKVWAAEWQAEYATARLQLESIGAKIPGGPCENIREGIRKATAMAAAGLTRSEIAEAMQIPITTLDGWRTDHRPRWDEEICEGNGGLHSADSPRRERTRFSSTRRSISAAPAPASDGRSLPAESYSSSATPRRFPRFFKATTFRSVWVTAPRRPKKRTRTRSTFGRPLPEILR